MKYAYECINDNCEEFEVKKGIIKSVSEASRVEHCKVCEQRLNKIFSVGGIRTADGVK